MAKIHAATVQADTDRFLAFVEEFEALVQKHGFNVDGYFVGCEYASADSGEVRVTAFAFSENMPPAVADTLLVGMYPTVDALTEIAALDDSPETEVVFHQFNDQHGTD